jgi:O-antigen ligase
MIAGSSLQAPAPRIRSISGLSAQSLGLMLTWLTLATSSIVFSEPAPYDALMIALIVMLPLLRLTSFSTGVFLLLIVWLVIGASGLIASGRANFLDVSIKHTAITIYLSLSSVLLAALVRKNPERHTQIIITGLMFASLLAALAGAVGYFNVLPGAHELFTKFERARGTFKDPNVFGPFIVPALIYYVHGMATSPTVRALVRSLLAGLCCLGLLISFSRGAWFNAAVALLVYGYVVFIASQTHRLRLKLILIAAFGLSVAALGLAGAMQVDSIANLIGERTSLALSYDIGPEGRFGGQMKALELVAANPFGIGALEFGRSYHGEDVHNVYLSMFLNSGWIGGFLYVGLVFTTLAVAFKKCLQPRPTQGITIVLLASFAGLAVEGMIVDTDHWRHFYVVMGVLWGLIMAKDAYVPVLVIKELHSIQN